MLEIRNTIIKLENVLNVLISRLITVNERNSELKDITIGTSRTEKKSEQRITIKTDGLWNNYKICAHYRNTRRRKRKKKKKEGIFKI